MILLGVTGSVAAYKAAEVLRLFVKARQEAHVIMTPAAAHFVGPLTFQALSGHPVVTDTLDPRGWQTAHLDLPERAQAMVIAPATADTLSRLAAGGAGDVVCACALALPRDAQGRLKTPLFIAPAMHEAMWLHPATQANVKTLQSFGYRFIGPEAGDLSRAGDRGPGRLSEPQTIVDTVLGSLAK